ncbi:hypothetical protein THTE_1191 [Thermogutta terrifontis]|uniref:Uncharacterized protein n=1 Tax=Thermogutta terrifontis TaxID=1331910 RepID=A0A286RCV5_9BACT|nr:hypothetical protein THTE_1191 [Thermogutta terrifontis]
MASCVPSFLPVFPTNRLIGHDRLLVVIVCSQAGGQIYCSFLAV